ncbi:ras and EF-hand domain-containing protein homolog isoform X2 [Artemia franciscana]|uniref:ras and EF-hand domain-containing protein homolog isoform X2 n=1 Tax=Artemia franciscana TaxID=6661 RepID=UPI0032DA1C1B
MMYAENIFNQVDEDSDGYIGLPEFQKLCLRLKIDPCSSVDLFKQLDKDCDGKISLEEFSKSLNDHLNVKGDIILLSVESQLDQREREAEIKWEKYLSRLSTEAVDCLNKRYLHFKETYIRIYSFNNNVECLAIFEQLISNILEEIHVTIKEKQAIEEMIRKERHSHAAQLRELEEELESHITRVTEVALREAENKYREENERIRSELEVELAELRARVSIMNKIENLRGRESSGNADLKRKLSEALQENRRLMSTIAETEATLFVIQSENNRRTIQNFDSDGLFSHLVNEQSVQSSTDGGVIQSVSFDLGKQKRPLTYPGANKQNFRVSTPDSAIASFSTGEFSKKGTGSPDVSLLDELVEAKYYGVDEAPGFCVDGILGSGHSEERNSLLVDRVFKVVFAGNPAVGKSSFISRLVDGKFNSDTQSTVGVDFKVKTISIDNRTVTLQLWDTAGQERFRSMTQTYFRRSDGVILIFDVSNERSLLDIREWFSLVEPNDCS